MRKVNYDKIYYLFNLLSYMQIFKSYAKFDIQYFSVRLLYC